MNILRTAMLVAALTALFMGLGYLIGGTGGMVVAFLVAAGLNFFSYWNGDALVLRMHRAREVDAGSAPDLHEMVARLTERAGLPMPRLYVIDTVQPNAFATGRNPRHAAVAVTTGLIHTLSYEEIAGVVAHELAHVQHRDTLIMTLTATIAGAISMLANFGFFFGGANRSDNNNPFGAVGLILGIIVAPIAALLVQMAISRTREYAADRRGAEITGTPRALASALGKISGAARLQPNVTAEANPATAHLFIVNPLSGARMDNLFSTHPAVENRIAALLRLDAAMGGGAPSAPVRPMAPGPWAQTTPRRGPWG